MGLKRSLLFCLLAWLGACSSLANESYAGEPLFVVSGRIEKLDPLLEQSGETRIAIVWTNFEGQTIYRAYTQAITATSFPAKFDFAIYETPPASEIVQQYPPYCHPGVKELLLAQARDGDLNDPLWFLPLELLGMLTLSTHPDPISSLQLQNQQEYFETLIAHGLLPTTNEEIVDIAGCHTTLEILKADPDSPLLEQSVTLGAAIGQIYVFQDVDGNQLPDPDPDYLRTESSDQVIGTAYDTFIMYLPERNDALHEYLGLDGKLSQGFNVVVERCRDGISSKHLVYSSNEASQVTIRSASEDWLAPECGESL